MMFVHGQILLRYLINALLCLRVDYLFLCIICTFISIYNIILVIIAFVIFKEI